MLTYASFRAVAFNRSAGSSNRRVVAVPEFRRSDTVGHSDLRVRDPVGADRSSDFAKVPSQCCPASLAIAIEVSCVRKAQMTEPSRPGRIFATVYFRAGRRT